jgi:hypothetical protein
MYEFEGIYFDWNAKKHEINKRKHRISFFEATTAFKDENALIMEDEYHSEYEERFVLLGLSKTINLLVVCHCYRENEESVIRIISARKANKKEEQKYKGGD